MVFIFAGLLFLFVLFGHHTAGFLNLNSQGGLFPNGATGLIIPMLVVIK
ncbi:gamma-aminobutyrate permease [Bacillus cereus]|nr:gamma-aminobutyrate permease [Bacillus cereus]PFE50801.1 gamma-aminobutyrate permease [Bacillus cereus]PFN14380.1 gamma-aminobutyrate permease [Bacillus cereus]PFS74319.1 gamma-aminobutyrate permease [Bacillus cereus]PGY21020.1 gamma-aminobutyrate permease [Bacillus cereus]